ncbi:sodium:solute symporter family protein [Phytoactinopolyspora endophytica]|uniref:sodium:solute symporter family protein n=1 Tax=Phytoactinopolyspora endophytica TaxID=1642495 RepID=UPI00101D3576|nr:sodium:solute symporter family protein [Phytoactinopolyspora endophytica]
MSHTAIVLAGAAVFVILMILLGRAAAGKTSMNTESYFLANRGLKRFVLFAAIFGTNMTAFVMLGLPGVAYHTGIGTWAMLAGPLLFVMPLSFYFGYRCWLVARRYGYVTPVEFYRERFASDGLAILMFLGFVGWTVPYVLTGVMGGGRAMESFTDGAVPFWLGALAVTVVVAYYTWAGGMKGTAWTNTAQALLFMAFLALTVVLVPRASGGVGRIADSLRDEQPELLVRPWEGAFSYGATVSQFILFSFIIFAFPFVWIRMISAQSARDLRVSGIAYPVATVLTWGPAILLGLWGASLVPGLVGAEADSIIFILTGQLLPSWVSAFGLVALLAIVMSSMDAQILTVSNMLSRDIVARYRRESSPASQVRYARVFVLALLALVYGISLLELPGIFDIAQFAFTGFAVFYPLLIAGIFWRRATKWGAMASLVVGQALAITGYLDWYPTVGGLQPVFWGVLIGAVVLVAVSLATPRQDEAAERFHAVWDELRTGRSAARAVHATLGDAPPVQSTLGDSASHEAAHSAAHDDGRMA